MQVFPTAVIKEKNKTSEAVLVVFWKWGIPIMFVKKNSYDVVTRLSVPKVSSVFIYEFLLFLLYYLCKIVLISLLTTDYENSVFSEKENFVSVWNLFDPLSKSTNTIFFS